MTSPHLIELTLKTLSCTQKELARRLNISQTQISKWKKGEHMSPEMEAKLRELIDLDTMCPELILWSGSKEEAAKWEELIHYLANRAKDCEETGYDTWPLDDEMGHLAWDTLETLRNAGVDMPRVVPSEISSDISRIDSEETGEEESESIEIAILEENKYTKAIWELFLSFNCVWGFYSAFIEELIDDDDLNLMNTDACELEYLLLDLAACKADITPNDEDKFRTFKSNTINNIEKSINIIKNAAIKSKIPLRAELLKLSASSQEELCEHAEAESLGLNRRRLHPDIYMNEILCGMRLIHQVLPVILKKLDINFELNRSDFYIE
jgi:transcriptional regulator with XRE-family HTH domain